ncbi:MAG: Maf family protein [Parvularculales bacterium]
MSHPSRTLILASASPRRKDLLAQIGVTPAVITAAELDETPRPGEIPRLLAKRLACEKANTVAARHSDGAVLAADTVVACGRRILPKATDEEAARACLTLLSGRAHRVYTAVCLVINGKALEKMSETRLIFKRLHEQEIAAYLKTGEWHGKAGGYAIQGYAGAFVRQLTGSWTGVVGLPLFETAALLNGNGLLPATGGGNLLASSPPSPSSPHEEGS